MNDKLTAGEQAVLVELAKGPRSQDEIAQRLGVSTVTVKRRLSDMRDKTGAESSIQLLLWALREAQRINRRFPPLGDEMNIETTINHCHIMIIAKRVNNKPPIAYVTPMDGVPSRWTLVDAQRRLRQLREQVTVMEEVERMLTPVSIVSESEQVAGSAGQELAQLVDSISLP